MVWLLWWRGLSLMRGWLDSWPIIINCPVRNICVFVRQAEVSDGFNLAFIIAKLEITGVTEQAQIVLAVAHVTQCPHRVLAATVGGAVRFHFPARATYEYIAAEVESLVLQCLRFVGIKVGVLVPRQRGSFSQSE